MNARVLILLLCAAGLVSVFWPSEVMSPSQAEMASAGDSSMDGELLDLSQFEPARVEEEMAPQEVTASQEVQPRSLLGRDRDSLTRQGEILAHEADAMVRYLNTLEFHPERERFLLACAYLALEQAEESETVWEGLSDSAPVSSVERAVVRRILSGGEGAPVPASSGGNNAVVLGLEMAWMQSELRRSLRARDFPLACVMLSGLLEHELMADWEAHPDVLQSWMKQLNEIQGFHRWSKKGEWASMEYVVQPGDSLVKIRKHVIEVRPGFKLSTGLIARANQLKDKNSIYPGQKLRIPLDPVHTVVDLSARILLYYHGEEVVCAWPVTIGREGRTIPGVYEVGQKKEEPMWFPQGRAPVPYEDAENPLGTRWIAWNGSNGLGFHGTREEDRIGEAASDGCVRLRNADVEELFEILPGEFKLRKEDEHFQPGSQVVVQP